MTHPTRNREAFFEGQALHAISLACLLALLTAATMLDGFTNGDFLGVSTSMWVIAAVSNAIIHQVYVWLCWRFELGTQALTRVFGQRGFLFYQIGFAFLIIARPILAFALSWANRSTAPIDPLLGYIVAGICFTLAAYMMFSVKTYFSFERAFGIDHFDASFRDKPLVRQGMFRWSPNAMYVFGFLILWAPAFLFQSTAGLVVAAFSHAYIWVHYFCTERPDMRRIYG